MKLTNHTESSTIFKTYLQHISRDNYHLLMAVQPTIPCKKHTKNKNKFEHVQTSIVPKLNKLAFTPIRVFLLVTILFILLRGTPPNCFSYHCDRTTRKILFAEIWIMIFANIWKTYLQTRIRCSLRTPRRYFLRTLGRY